MQTVTKLKVAIVENSDMDFYLLRLSLAKALIREGYDVYAIVPPGEFLDKIHNEGIKNIVFPVNRRGNSLVNELRTVFKLYRIFRNERFDILHTFRFQPNVYGAIAAKLANIDTVINHITGLGYVYTESNFRTKLLRLVVFSLYAISFKLAKRVILQNSDDLEELKAILNPDKAVIIEGSGVDVDSFSSYNVDADKKERVRGEFSIEDNTIVITMVSRLLWQKGIKHLVEAADILTKEYSNSLFLLVGWADEENPSRVSEDFIWDSQRNSRIRFLGKRYDVKEILAVTDIFALPSYYREGVPRSLLEAMSMSKPIVTTNVPGCRLTVNHGLNGFLIPPRSTQALAESLEKLIVDSDLRKKMGQESRKKVVREFSDEVVLKKIIRIYKLLGSELFHEGK